MNDFGFVLVPYLVTFLLVSVFWMRVMRTFFSWLGLGPR